MHTASAQNKPKQYRLYFSVDRGELKALPGEDGDAVPSLFLLKQYSRSASLCQAETSVFFKSVI